MRDHFLDQLGGSRFAREEPTDDGDAKSSTDQATRPRLFGAQRAEVVEDQQSPGADDTRSDAGEVRQPGTARTKAWPWVAAAVALAAVALVWIGFSYRHGGRSTATAPPAQVT